MAKVTPITEQFQNFVSELKESFWGDLQGQVQQSMRRLFELLTERQRDLYMVEPAAPPAEGAAAIIATATTSATSSPASGRCGCASPAPASEGFLPAVLQKFQRRAEEVSLLIREAFLRGISTRQVGRLVAILTGEPVSPQTVSRLTRELDEAVLEFIGRRWRTSGRTCFWTG